MKATSKYRKAMISVGRWPAFQNVSSLMPGCSGWKGPAILTMRRAGPSQSRAYGRGGAACAQRVVCGSRSAGPA
jgi:hypothetical protein